MKDAERQWHAETDWLIVERDRRQRDQLTMMRLRAAADPVRYRQALFERLNFVEETLKGW